DGPDQTSPQLGQFSGSSLQEAISSTSNHILLRFHSDFSTSGFFVLHYYGELRSLPAASCFQLHHRLLTRHLRDELRVIGCV
ncbi:CUB and sushi domain-containing protein 3, partial [Tachysurus ichikawai]